MKKKDYIIIGFFLVIFLVVLIDRKFNTVTNSAGKTVRKTELMRQALEERIANFGKAHEKGVPPAGLNTKSFYDEKGNFKSYYEGKLPDEFLTKVEHFTDPHKMQDDIDYKRSKMLWHQEAEREEFKKFHDYLGKDKKKYNELLDKHAKAQHEANEKNRETWKQLKRDSYQYDSELR